MGDLLLVLLFLALVARTGWPVTLWVVCAGAMAWGARLAVKRGAMPVAGKHLLPTLTGIVAGVGLVWLAQVLLTGAAVFASDAVQRSTEASIAGARVALVWVVRPEVFAAMLASSVVLGMCGRGRAGAILAAAASVVFSGAQAARLAEARWVESRRTEASGDLRALRDAQSRLVAAAEVRRQFAALTPADQGYVDAFLRATESKRHHAEILAMKGEGLASRIDEPALPAPIGVATVGWTATSRCDAWLSAAESESERLAPSLADLAAMGAVSRALQDCQAQDVQSLDPLQRAVTDAAARRWPRRAWGASVWDAPSATAIVSSTCASGPSRLLAPADRASSVLHEVDASELALESADRGSTGAEGWQLPGGDSKPDEP